MRVDLNRPDLVSKLPELVNAVFENGPQHIIWYDLGRINPKKVDLDLVRSETDSTKEGYFKGDLNPRVMRSDRAVGIMDRLFFKQPHIMAVDQPKKVPFLINLGRGKVGRLKAVVAYNGGNAERGGVYFDENTAYVGEQHKKIVSSFGLQYHPAEELYTTYLDDPLNFESVLLKTVLETGRPAIGNKNEDGSFVIREL